jgi:c-di-GMP-binding flagellar brake protein YcgR
MKDSPADLDDARYQVDSDVEVAYVLRGLARSKAVVTAHVSGSKEFAVTAVLDVDVQTNVVTLDASANQELNQRLIESSPVRFISNDEGVRVQFQALKVESALFQGRPALRITIPRSLYKMQRREYYRMHTPIVTPVKCSIPMGEDQVLEMSLSDISLGGICLAGEFGEDPPALGTILERCSIRLGSIGTLRIDLCVRNSYLIALKNGTHTRRTGCQFLAITPQQEAMVQRYIIFLEQQRKAKQG